jgi:hypothetical protein
MEGLLEAWRGSPIFLRALRSKWCIRQDCFGFRAVDGASVAFGLRMGWKRGVFFRSFPPSVFIFCEATW